MLAILIIESQKTRGHVERAGNARKFEGRRSDARARATPKMRDGAQS
jgi:hypothetical protein